VIERNTAKLKSHLEEKLAARLNRRHCVLTGRAASAIHIALKSLDLDPGKVVVPNISCPSPATVPLYSGHQPVFCDVSLRDFNMCPVSLRRVLDEYTDVRAIIPVHLYGQAAPMNEILMIAENYGVPVIEDAAQAFGAALDSKPLGSWGDLSIISFGHTKTLNVGWGGAVLTNDDLLAQRLRRQERVLPQRPIDINEIFAEWRRVYYSLIPLTRSNDALHALFLPLPEIFKDMYLFSLDETLVDPIFRALDCLDDLVFARRKAARIYRAKLQNPRIHHAVLDNEDAPWRYTILVNEELQKPVTDALRQAGIDASNWYPCLHRWYAVGRTQDESSFPNSCRVAAGNINLWVDPSISVSQIEKTCQIIQEVVSKECF
jgi:dTDP-4-amino-4,6-dideoxygalactose transaminase